MNTQNITKIENIEQHHHCIETTVFYGTKDIAKCLGCSLPTAREIMHRSDFPLIKVGKNLRVLKAAFEEWAMKQRI